ncbi:hypothetical protein [Planctobacterium marinum]|uniref:hypothetical protein n=1 Tax=Planctobacterium marinum TaxID=1631968 RepID=UPI001E47F5D4|nr:hypothetical protein [Planctobacterium marinum]MCC2604063.1 hypothetical protein [Planctobacterium marinum]
MNNVGSIQKLLLLVSALLFTIVGYLLFKPTAFNTSSASASVQQPLNESLLKELAQIETRLQRQIARLESDTIHNRTGESAVSNNKELQTLNRQLGLLLQRQEQYEQRLQQIENRINSMAMPANIALSDHRDINVLHAEPVEFVARNRVALSVEDMYSEQYEQNREVSIEQQIASYEDKLFEEGIDSEWTRSVEKRVLEVIRDTKQLKGVHLQESNCGVSLCKLEVYVEEGESVEEKVQMLMVNRPWQGESFVSFEFTGEGAIFFAKEGERLP